MLPSPERVRTLLAASSSRRTLLTQDDLRRIHISLVFCSINLAPHPYCVFCFLLGRSPGARGIERQRAELSLNNVPPGVFEVTVL